MMAQPRGCTGKQTHLRSWCIPRASDAMSLIKRQGRKLNEADELKPDSTGCICSSVPSGCNTDIALKRKCDAEASRRVDGLVRCSQCISSSDRCRAAAPACLGLGLLRQTVLPGLVLCGEGDGVGELHKGERGHICNSSQRQCSGSCNPRVSQRR